MNERLFQDASRAGVFYWPKAEQGLIEASTAAAGLALHKIHITEPDNDSALRQIGRVLNFPDWYGANLDALHDCLTEPDWQSNSGDVVLISGLRALDRESAQALVEVFRSATENRVDTNSPLWVLMDMPTPQLSPLPGL